MQKLQIIGCNADSFTVDKYEFSTKSWFGPDNSHRCYISGLGESEDYVGFKKSLCLFLAS